MPLTLSPAQFRTLAAICDTFLPSLNDADTAELVRSHLGTMASVRSYDPEALQRVGAEAVTFCRLTAAELGVPETCQRALGEHLPRDTLSAISMVLKTMSSSVGMLALCGVFVPFADLEPSKREAVLLGLSNSRFIQKRQAFQALKGLITFKAFGGTTGRVNGSKPLLWQALGYAGPESCEQVEAALAAVPGRRAEHRFRMMNDELHGDTVLDAEVVVVGSGCGGAVVAAELASAGYKVLVLEKGRYFPRSDMSGVECEAIDQMYERGGLTATEDTGLNVLAASTFGGGSTVNWACSLRTPDYVRREWADVHGLPRIAADEFSASLDAVCSRIGVTATGVAHNRNNQLFMEGCQRCGFQIETAPQNMADVSSCATGAASISLGDRYGIKQCMTETFLRDAATCPVPAQFVDQCHVSVVLHEGGVARGVKAEVVGSGGQRFQLTVKAKAVVVACGSIHSPALLLRSGLRNAHIGKNLRLHPVSMVVGQVPAGTPDVAIWEGAPMTSVSNECVAGPVGDNYGCKVECPCVHPGFAAAVMPWQSGRHFKETMLGVRRFMWQIVLVRDRGSGEIRLDAQKSPRLYYPLSEHDKQSMLDGLEAAIRATAAVGVEKIGTTQAKAMGGFRSLPPVAMAEERKAAVEEFIADVRRVGFPLHQASLFSAHQMGTCRMGASAKDSVVDGDGQSWEVQGLFVADASVFPTPSGTNPMVTTLAMAHLISQQMKKKLQLRSKL